jgi:hypothetical protein
MVQVRGWGECLMSVFGCVVASQSSYQFQILMVLGSAIARPFMNRERHNNPIAFFVDGFVGCTVVKAGIELYDISSTSM